MTEPYFIGRDGNEDWAKRTLDFPDVSSAEELREVLRDMGEDVEEFKSKPAYWMALDSGQYPWLEDL